ncbi:MAG: peptidoglycan-binding protein [Clostridiaceae bacterium]
MKRRILIVALALISALNIAVYSHSGRTDSSGGHRDNKNKSGLGSYHYHCGGYPAHLHNNGICPYKNNVSTQTKTETKSASIAAPKSTEKSKNVMIQEKLNSLGYDCGEADGIIGKKTKMAIKQFQKDNGLVADGIAGSKTLKALGLD